MLIVQCWLYKPKYAGTMSERWLRSSDTSARPTNIKMFITFPTFPQRPNQQEEAESNPPPPHPSNAPRPWRGAEPTQERSWKSFPNANWIKFTYKLTNKID